MSASGPSGPLVLHQQTSKKACYTVYYWKITQHAKTFRANSLLSCICWLIFYKITLLSFINSNKNTIRASNSLDPDQARHFVGPDLDPNCFQRVPADDTSTPRVNIFHLNPEGSILSMKRFPECLVKWWYQIFLWQILFDSLCSRPPLGIPSLIPYQLI